MASQSTSYRYAEVAETKSFTKIIKTQKGNLLLVPCIEAEAETIYLIMARGGFRGGFSRIEAVDAEILLQRDGNIHCCPTSHIVARLKTPKGYIYTETGRRCSTGDIEIYCEEGYLRMPAEEFEVWQEQRKI